MADINTEKKFTVKRISLYGKTEVNPRLVQWSLGQETKNKAGNARRGFIVDPAKSKGKMLFLAFIPTNADIGYTDGDGFHKTVICEELDGPQKGVAGYIIPGRTLEIVGAKSPDGSDLFLTITCDGVKIEAIRTDVFESEEYQESFKTRCAANKQAALERKAERQKEFDKEASVATLGDAFSEDLFLTEDGISEVVIEASGKAAGAKAPKAAKAPASAEA